MGLMKVISATAHLTPASSASGTRSSPSDIAKMGELIPMKQFHQSLTYHGCSWARKTSSSSDRSRFRGGSSALSLETRLKARRQLGSAKLVRWL